MFHSYMGNYASAFVPGFFAGWLTLFTIPVAIWSVVWMGLALWRAAKNDSKGWFIVLLLVHTMGILDILYLFVFSKPKKSSKKK